MGASLGQWLGLLGIFGVVAFLYYGAKFADNIVAQSSSKKKRKNDREEKRRKLREDMEDKEWLRAEKEKIRKEISERK